MIGIPYAYWNEDGSRTCPVCGERIPEKHDRTGEAITNEYAAHYEARHAEEETG